MLFLNDTNNFGCQLRDGIYEQLRKGTLTRPILRQKLAHISIPQEYWGDILRMVHYRQYDRITDPIEQLLERVVIRHIIEQLITK